MKDYRNDFGQTLVVYIISHIILRLSHPQLLIFPAFISEQFLVGAGLDDGALVENCNLITELAGGQTVADINSCFVACYLVEFFIYLCF